MITTMQTEVLVIGGRATGGGGAWDCALRGFDTILAERRDLAEGTSGRFHGLLHSGGRYVVKDRLAAEEGVAENASPRGGPPNGTEGTGGCPPRPRVNPRIARAFTVPDASIDVWLTVGSLAAGAAAHGARILTYH